MAKVPLLDARERRFAENRFGVLGVCRKPFVETSLDEFAPENNPVGFALRLTALFLEDKRVRGALTEALTLCRR